MNSDGTVKRQVQHDVDNFPNVGSYGNNAYVGNDIDAIGDIDGDGVIDIVVGAEGDESVAILMLNPDGTLKNGYELNNSTSAAYFSAHDYGFSVAGAGDWNRDGTPDILVSAHLDDDGGTNRGTAYVHYLSGDGSEIGFAKFSDQQGGLDIDLDDSDYFGFGVASLGDFNRDGILDFVAGAYADDDNGADNGAIYMIQNQQAKYPGGVSAGLRAWWDPARGTNINASNQVEEWTDVSPNGFSLAQATSTYWPVLRPGFFNGHPGIDFDSSDDSLENNNLQLLPNSTGTIIMIASNENYASNVDTLFSFGSDGDDIGIVTDESLLGVFEDNSTPTSEYGSTTLISDQPNIFDVRFASGTDVTITLGIDGNEELLTTMDIPSIESQFAIGGSVNQTEAWNGSIGEVLVFDVQLTGTDLQKVRSYLATKYGITLENGTVNYLDTAGSVVYDVTADAGFNNDIAGIARDDDEYLDHTRSRSANVDSLVTMYIREGSTGLDDKEYFFWSNDDGAMTGTNSVDVPASVDERMERVWNVQEV